MADRKDTPAAATVADHDAVQTAARDAGRAAVDKMTAEQIKARDADRRD